MAFGLFGIGLLIAAGVFALSVLTFQGRATRAEGTVTTSSAGGSHPVIRFTDQRGVVGTFSGNGLIFGYRRGDKVAVLYESSAPQRSVRLAAVGSLWFFPIMFSVIGLAFLIGPFLPH